MLSGWVQSLFWMGNGPVMESEIISPISMSMTVAFVFAATTTARLVDVTVCDFFFRRRTQFNHFHIALMRGLSSFSV